MNDRGARRSYGAPFYAAPRRKTSAEIISEARAAISAEMSSLASGVGGALRPLRTRRPFTPREPQRTLFTENARKKDARPPSAFDLKHLKIAESSEDDLFVGFVADTKSGHRDEEAALETLPENGKKIPAVRPLRASQERSNEGWSRFTKLPHLSGRSKPLHRRNTTEQTGVSPDTSSKRKQFSSSKSVSYEAGSTLGEVFVKQLEVQLPNTFHGHDDYSNMSVLELAEALSQKTRDTDRIVQLLEALQNIIVRTSPANSLRDLVLRSLYTHIDCEDERVLVAIARAMLTMCVTGAHLAAACKLVFKIARNDKNDHFFKNSNLLDLLVEGCGRADPLSESECCVYAAGALRFLALEPRLCALAHRAGALPLAALHLKILNNAKTERPRQVSEQATHALYQVTGALRNLAGGEGSGRAFAASGVLADLLAALTLHTDRDVLTNVARCLSVLSAEESCCAWLCASPASASALLTALAACASRAPLTVRLAYTLGNMAAADEQARINIYNEEGGIDVLLTILESYVQRNESDARDLDADPDLHLVGSDLGGSDGSNEDVLIKTVRVIANLCLAEIAGRGLAASYAERTVRALLSCLQLAEKPVQKSSDTPSVDHESSLERHEELAMAALATLNNITFFFEPSESSHHNILEQLCKATCRWVRGSGAAACEAARALGNLTRSARAAQLVVLEGALEALPPLLHHEDPSVRCAAAGVLVNVCGAGGAGGAVGAAARALSDAALVRDVSAAALLARALWNAHAHCPLDPAHAQQTTAALALFIEDDSLFSACEVPKMGDRRASDPQLSRIHHVKFDIDNNNYEQKVDFLHEPSLAVRACSVEEDLHLEQDDDEGERYSGEDLGFEEGELEECDCGPCKRLSAWEELVGVAIPLLEQLRPKRADASVGTEPFH
ncbi:armadillo repeat-containing protein 2 [Bicyclus anynana]|uniref:Armadillo repeat-containing protein 2 n=1 Tax=Bicyclus anynana TaxID=110368 RepID=A0ABM3LJ84_BICAN|nr:armadillo repeat-containing protein 2 [Bicyclus anynana]